jgi:putative ABC transport system permease protein
MPEWPRDIREEVRQHLDDQYRELRASGASHDDAMRAMAADVAALTRDPMLMNTRGLAADFRYACRTLRKSLGFSSIVIATLALGIGANTAIFSVVNSVMLRPLPYDRAGRLVVVWGNLHKPGLEEIPGSAAEFVDYRDRNRVFDAIAAYDTGGVTVTGLEGPERVSSAITTASLFAILSASPSLGRAFTAADEQPGRDRVAIVSHAFWQRRLGGATNVIGRTITVDLHPFEIIGVMPDGFAFPDDDTELWRPLAFTADDVSENQRGSHSYTIIGHLKDGVTVERAQAEMRALGMQMGAEHRGVYRTGFSAAVRPLHEELVGASGPALLTLMAAVIVVLLIACANVANLLLARGAARQREMAIRAALGASRVRVLRQLLVESVLLAAAGGAVGLALAATGIRALVALAPTTIPRINEIAIDARVIVLTTIVSVVTGVVFGLAPALHASTPDLNDTLKDGTRGAGEGRARGRMRRALVAAEVALSLVLLVAAGLLINSFARVQVVDPGFRADHLLTARLALPASKYPSIDRAQRFFDDLFGRLRQQPGVQGVAAINAVPFSGRGGDRSFFIEGRALAPGEPSPDEQVRFVTAAYFSAMNIPVRGREFTERDVSSSVHVAVVNDALARKYWPRGDAIGKRVQFQQDTMKRYEIVGIAGNIRHGALDAAPKPELYVPVFQPLFDRFAMPAMDLVIRTAQEPQTLAMALRQTVAALDPDQPVADVRTMEERIGQSLAVRRFNMLLLVLFASVALVLAAIGMSGLVAYAVAQRTREIGVRLALGAQPREVVALLVRDGMMPALAGAAAGLAIAIGATRLMSSLLFGVGATDAATFATVAALLAVVALVACWLPARRATRVDPVLALRAE